VVFIQRGNWKGRRHSLGWISWWIFPEWMKHRASQKLNYHVSSKEEHGFMRDIQQTQDSETLLKCHTGILLFLAIISVSQYWVVQTGFFVDYYLANLLENTRNSWMTKS
jgi:hypothetical protein